MKKLIKVFKNKIKTRAKLPLYLCVLVGFFIFVSCNLINKKDWPEIIVNGRLTGKMFSDNKYLIFGTNDAKLNAVNIFDSKLRSSVDLNTGAVYIQDKIKNKVVTISDDKLSLVDFTNSKIIWQVNTSDQTFFKKAQVYKNYILATANNRTLSAYNLKDGELVWQFKSDKLDRLSKIVYGEDITYIGDFVIAKGIVVLDSKDGRVVGIDIKNGKLVWFKNLSSEITAGPVILSENVYLATTSNSILGYKIKSGNEVLKSNSDQRVECLNVQNKYFGHFLYEYLQDGKFVKRNLKDGSVVWKIEDTSNKSNCPTLWKKYAVFSIQSGGIMVVNLNSGSILNITRLKGQFKSDVVIKPKFSSFLPNFINPFYPDFILNNDQGDLYFINGIKNYIYWKHSINAPSNNTFPPLFVLGRIFFASSDGVVYKINKNSGFPPQTKEDATFEISGNFEEIGDSKIYELTLASHSAMENPWRSANVSVDFVSESGRSVRVPGFYYDKNIWKIRFNPPDKGKWKWKLSWTPHGKTYFKEGIFESYTDTRTTYLKISDVNPKRFTLDGKNIFNGIGLGDAFYDVNQNGTPIDDWAIGDENAAFATSAAGIAKYLRSDEIISTNKYLEIYGPKGAGFNMFRWSLMNGSQGLWTKFGYPTVYSNLQLKIGDSLVKSLKSNGVHVWLTMFGFDIPYKASEDPSDIYQIKSYVRYLFARYGAYVDIWELANEFAVPKNTASMIKNELKSLDWENRPVSVSSDGYNEYDGDIISPHWYDNENIQISDSETQKLIENRGHIDKPVVFTEQGNKSANYDSLSGTRMRVRSWTAFMNEGILMFWNQSDVKTYKEAIFPGNIYLGSEEKKYISILQELTRNFSIDSKKVYYDLANFGVRGYGLNSEKLTAGYFYHFASPFTYTNFTITIFTKSGGNVEWIDPLTGKSTNGGYCQPGSCNLFSPIFKTDLVLFINRIK